MAILRINPMKLMGPWAAGYVLDYHSVSAVPTGDPYHPFEMKYTELGDRLYRFKYRNDAGALPDILDTAENFVRGLGLKIDCLVPAPPSKPRGSQPVVQLARELAKRLSLSTLEAAVVKTKETPSMKNIPDWLERQKILGETVQAGVDKANGKAVMLIDDLVESGSTLRRAAEVLLKEGATAVYAVALTRTR